MSRTEGVISIEQVGRVELRVARIVSAEPHPDADRLLRLRVDLGSEQRQIIAGIAEAYAPDALLGRSIVVVANLEPARLRGQVSEGMLLAATGEDGRPHLLTLDGDLAPGAKIS
ncbi:MAG TPA: methionine--tRNA ligase subunit beta [Acidobacteria bacterium]|nr:methionine--tRNA ligase subunit beta [Acidobacteriota bacterium]